MIEKVKKINDKMNDDKAKIKDKRGSTNHEKFLNTIFLKKFLRYI